MNNRLAELIVELRLVTRRACMCEGAVDNKKNTITLKTKVLFLIRKKLTSREMIATLGINKANLAIITRELAEEGLIEKSRRSLDRREVSYDITDKGKKYLSARLSAITENVSPYIGGNEDEVEGLIKKLISALGDTVGA